MKEILITWTSSWIWNFLAEKLAIKNKIYWLSRKNSWLEIQEFLWDINDDFFLQEIYKKIPEIDYLILNAWVWYFDNFEKISLNEHKEILNTNLISPITLTHLFLNKIKSWIIFIWSISSKKSGKYWASYSASKFGLRGFAMNLKNETKWIKIHLINPKIVKTNFHNNSKIEIVWKYKETKIEDILDLVNKIIDKTEKRFEIDL
jgi:short-subunit dehydrogenase